MRFKKVFLVYNPESGRHRAESKAKRVFKLLLKEGLDCVILKSSSAGEDQDCFKLIKKSPNSLVIAFGGDGTLGAIANQAIKSNADCVLSVFPCGTASDFALSAKTPKKPNSFVKWLLKKEPRTVDLMLVNNSLVAVNAVGAGNFSNGSTNYNAKLKERLGIYGYYFRCLKEFFNLSSVNLTFKTESEIFSCETYLYYLINSKRAGGFSRIASEAETDDGVLDLIVIKKCSKIDCLGVFKDICLGRASKNKNIITKKVRSCEISGGENHPKFEFCDIDGFKGPRGTLRVEVLPQRAKFLI